jgi:hypothetical protein
MVAHGMAAALTDDQIAIALQVFHCQHFISPIEFDGPCHISRIVPGPSEPKDNL